MSLLWIIALDNSGAGKTHARLAPGLTACPVRRAQERLPGQLPAAGLVHQLREARDERRLLKMQAQLAAVKLLIIDELGYVPLLSSSKRTDRRGKFAAFSTSPGSWRGIDGKFALERRNPVAERLDLNLCIGGGGGGGKLSDQTALSAVEVGA
jgi:hypothetical protein